MHRRLRQITQAYYGLFSLRLRVALVTIADYRHATQRNATCSRNGNRTLIFEKIFQDHEPESSSFGGEQKYRYMSSTKSSCYKWRPKVYVRS